MTPDSLRDEVNKRLTLNWLIQGVSQHVGLTVHHLVRDDLTALDPDLVRLYDQIALVSHLQYWSWEFVVRHGSPQKFWRRASADPHHPFYHHPLLARHGGMLAAESRRRAVERCREKGVTVLPGAFWCQANFIVAKALVKEPAHKPALVEIAKKAAATVWGIPTDRLTAALCDDVAFGKLNTPRTFRGRISRWFVVGYGGVLRENGTLRVVGRGKLWWILAKELIKGTAELICLHGLNTLSDDACRHVLDHTDHIEIEPWMLQSGGELWRRLLAVFPDGRPIAEMLMHLARLPPRPLETLMLAVIEQPEWARELLAGLGRADAEPTA